MSSFGPKAQKSSSKGKWLLTILVTFVETLVTLSSPQCRFTYHSFANKRQSQSIGKGENNASTKGKKLGKLVEKA